jgi:HEPN domain-containing protein
MTMSKSQKIVKVKDNYFLANLIYPTALQYLNGAIILDKYFQENIIIAGTLDTYDASYLLRILSLELFLKTVVILTKGESIHGHVLEEIYEYFDPEIRNSILITFNKLCDSKYSDADIKKYLAQYGKNFVSIRYPYECFKDKDMDEYLAMVRRFMESKPDDFTHAQIVYKSKELYSLVESIKSVCENLINR